MHCISKGNQLVFEWGWLLATNKYSHSHCYCKNPSDIEVSTGTLAENRFPDLFIHFLIKEYVQYNFLSSTVLYRELPQVTKDPQLLLKLKGYVLITCFSKDFYCTVRKDSVVLYSEVAEATSWTHWRFLGKAVVIESYLSRLLAKEITIAHTS